MCKVTRFREKLQGFPVFRVSACFCLITADYKICSTLISKHQLQNICHYLIFGLLLAGLDMAQSIVSWPVLNARIFLNGNRLLLHNITGYYI